MNKLFSALNLSSFGSPDSPLYPLFESLESHRQNYSNRKKEIEELVQLLALRVEAETTYAQNLYKIADRPLNDTIKIGLLAKEIKCYKQDCFSKAKAAEELADNVAQDCT